MLCEREQCWEMERMARGMGEGGIHMYISVGCIDIAMCKKYTIYEHVYM